MMHHTQSANFNHVESTPAADEARVPSPLATLLVVWCLPLMLLVLGVIQYDGVSFESLGMLYLLACLVVFLIGFEMGTLRKSYLTANILSHARMRESLERDVLRLRGVITFFAVAGIAAAALFSAEMLLVVQIRPTDFEATRTAFSSREVTVLSQIATVLGAGGYLSLVAAILGWGRISRLERTLWLLSPVLLSAFSLLSAGRQTILQLIVITFFALLLRGKSGRSRSRRITGNMVFAGIVFLALAYGMIVASLRSGENVAGAKGALLSQLFLVRMSPDLETALDDQPAIIRDGTAELLVYFTHPIPNFLIFFELPRPGPYWGLWQFPFLARRLDSVGIITGSESERFGRVYAMFAVTGRSPQVWQTVFRDLIIDFGDIGALLVTLLFGFWAGRVYYRMRTRGGLVGAYLLVGINLLCVYSVLFSGSSDTLVFFYFVATVFLYFRYEFNRREAASPSDATYNARSGMGK